MGCWFVIYTLQRHNIVIEVVVIGLKDPEKRFTLSVTKKTFDYAPSYLKLIAFFNIFVYTEADYGFY